MTLTETTAFLALVCTFFGAAFNRLYEDWHAGVGVGCIVVFVVIGLIALCDKLSNCEDTRADATRIFFPGIPIGAVGLLLLILK